MGGLPLLQYLLMPVLIQHFKLLTELDQPSTHGLSMQLDTKTFE